MESLVKKDEDGPVPDEKDIIDQGDSIDPKSKEHLKAIAWCWGMVQEKLAKDKICFGCKSIIEEKDNKKIEIFTVAGTDKGLVAFCSLCPTCVEKFVKQKKMDEEKKAKEKK